MLFNLPYKDIKVAGQHYLRRFYLGTLFGVTFYIHHFIRGDSDRNLHNHPFNAWSFILKGFYLEERFIDFQVSNDNGCKTKIKKVRWFNIINGNTFHKVLYTKPGTLTLFCHRPYIAGKKWGFLTKKWDWRVDESGDCVEVVEFREHEGSTDISTKWWIGAPKANIFAKVQDDA